MTVARQPYGQAGRLRCDLCGDVIGVYEPVVLVSRDGGWLLRTSLVVAPDAGERGLVFHADCHAVFSQRALALARAG
jgi:hypothetical protein